MTIEPWSRQATTGPRGTYKQAHIELSLFDLENDAFETTNVAAKYPDVTTRLKNFAEAHRAEFYS